MRTLFVAGNWKMNKTVAEARELVSVMGKELKNVKNVEKVLCPPFMSLVAVANLIGGEGCELLEFRQADGKYRLKQFFVRRGK